ncbi:MAG: hypothetical protein EAZ95_15840 [Bacteroidetes bacterium]|nr:MAG: hypothetical protein EAZ95_15840 [Bacteroidota bacterium]
MKKIPAILLILCSFCLACPIYAQHKPPVCLQVSTTSSVPSDFANSNNQFFFRGTAGANDGYGIEPRFANCATKGIANNVRASVSGSDPRYFVFYNGLTYYLANHATNSSGLYSTNGVHNPATLPPVDTVSSHANSALYGGMVKAGNYLYFIAQNDVSLPTIPNQPIAHNVELWQSDGTKAGTVQVAEINPIVPSNTIIPNKNGSSFPRNLTPTTIDGVEYLFFTADEAFFQVTSLPLPSANATNTNFLNENFGNRELYVRQANAPASVASTKIEINPDTASTYTYNCTSYPCNNTNYTFSAYASSWPIHLTPYNNKLYFIATANGVTGVGANSGDKIWYTDGVTKGSITLPGNAIIDREVKMVVSGNLLYFVAYNDKGRELWKFDGINASMIKDLYDGAIDGIVAKSGVYTFNMVDVNGTLFFAGNKKINPTTPETGIELFKTDGNTITLVKDIYAGSMSSYPRKMANVNGVLYFFANNTLGKPEFWQHIPVETCDNSFVATKQYFTYIQLGNLESDFGQITPVGNDFYFLLSEMANGPEPWYAESCPTVSLTYGTNNTLCGATSANPSITFTKTSLQSCAPAVTTPPNLCPSGNCFCSPDLGAALDTNTGTINLAHPLATGVHKICYYNKDGASECAIPVCVSVTIQPAVASADIVTEVVAGNGELGNNNGTQPDVRFKFSNSLTATNSIEDGNVSTAFSPDGGKMYVADEFNHLIRQVDLATGVVTTLAGSGNEGHADGIGTSASFRRPSGIATDVLGNIFVADKKNNLIRKIDPNTKEVITIAGAIGGGYADSANPLLATFSEPSDVVVDADGNFYISDKNNHAIRKISTTGAVSTLAGGNGSAFINGTGISAKFHHPTGMDLDANGDILVADRYNHAIRRVTPAGAVTTVAGTGIAGTNVAQFNFPNEVVSSLGKIYVADGNNHQIKQIAGGIVTNYAGNGSADYQEGLASSAKFNVPTGISKDFSGRLYVTDKLNVRIRRIKENNTGGQITGTTTVCAGTNSGSLVLTNNPTSVTKWEGSTNGGATWTNLGNAGATTYNYSNLTNTTMFRAVLSESACGTVRSDLATVNVFNLPTGGFTPANPVICLGGTVVFTAPPVPLGRSYQFVWSTDIAGSIISGQNTPVMTARWNVSNGTEYVRLKITVAGLNCEYITPLPASPTDLGFVQIKASPTPNITGNNQVCAKKTETYQTAFVLGNEYKWTVENGTIQGADNQAQVLVEWAENTSGSVLVGKLKLTEKTTSTNCQKDATEFLVNILPRPVSPTSPDRVVCASPATVILSATSAGATTYVWYDSPTANIPLTTATTYSPTITANVSFWVSAVHANGCESERKEVKITINPNMGNIVITPTLIHAHECVASGDSPSGKILLEIIGNNPPYEFAWSKNGSIFTPGTKDITGITKGDYRVRITDAGGCVTFSPVYTILEQLKTLQNPEIVYNGKVLADNEQIVVGQGSPTTLTAQAIDEDTYAWTDDNGGSVGIAKNCTITPREQGDYTYTVKITNSTKCSAERKVRVKVVGMNVYVPNIFSPNSDNQNDKLQVYGNGIKSVNFKVYNRLGELVYETDKWVEGKASDQAIGWDGFYKGKLQESGNYTWIISVTYINNSSEKNTGNIYLKY